MGMLVTSGMSVVTLQYLFENRLTATFRSENGLVSQCPEERFDRDNRYDLNNLSTDGKASQAMTHGKQGICTICDL
jgi:hypothetical protein